MSNSESSTTRESKTSDSSCVKTRPTERQELDLNRSNSKSSLPIEDSQGSKREIRETRGKITSLVRSADGTLRFITTQVDAESAETGNLRSKLRANADGSFSDLSHEEQFLISSAFTRSIDGITRSGSALFLDGLGIIFPETSREKKAELIANKVVVKHEEINTLEFEKCRELLSFHRERFGKVIELREIAQRVLNILPSLLQIRWSLETVKGFLQGLIRILKKEIVENGSSSRLEKIGVFYALHNRHGYSFDDWYAGADIFFVSNIKRASELSPPKEYPRPEISTSFEIFEAAYGAPIIDAEISLDQELASIGINCDVSSPLGSIKLAIFEKESDSIGATPGLIYVTDGIRSLPSFCLHFRDRLKPEIVVEIPGSERPQDGDGAGIPIWPARQIALAAAALLQRQTKGEDPYLLASPESVAKESRSRLSGVLVARFKSAPLPYIAVNSDVEGRIHKDEFTFVSALGVTTEEIALARDLSPCHLLELLRYKGLDRVTKSQRQTILNRCEVKPSKLPEYTRYSETRSSRPKLATNTESGADLTLADAELEKSPIQ